jgi:YVTN family beta-propeller protein
MDIRTVFFLGGWALVLGATGSPADSSSPYASPSALAARSDDAWLAVGCATANQILFVDTRAWCILGRIDVPAPPLGLVLSADGNRLYATCAAAQSLVCVIDVPQHRIVHTMTVGHTAMSPVLAPDEKTLYVCNRFDDDVSVIDLTAGRELLRIPVDREPIAAAITPSGQFLVVVNHLHRGRADTAEAAARVSLIETRTARVTRKIALPLGSGLVRGVALSPDGRFAAVTHLRSLYWLTTTSVELGRMNGNALTVLDLNRQEVLGTLMLDQTCRGAANPWAIVWAPDGKTIAVSHAGTHEVSLIDAPVEADRWSFPSLRLADYAERGEVDPLKPNHLVRVRARVSLPGNGPRALAIVGTQLYVANYFSDDIVRIDLTNPTKPPERLSLGSERELSIIRRGEMLFNDARLCAQGWQSCASCHDADARTDALNWDLLNDGAGNPKNTRSLVWSHRAGRAMALGVRANARDAVRAGIHHILFAEHAEDVAAPVDAWLDSLEPVPSPHLQGGQLSAAARRGQQLFASARTGCIGCHPRPLFTDGAAYDVGTANPHLEGLWGQRGADQPCDRFYSPPLVELWRTAPYLHDGSAPSLREVLSNDRHGHAAALTVWERDDLMEYLLSL